MATASTPSPSFSSRLWRFLVRNRFAIRDLGLLLAAVLVAAYLVFELRVLMDADTDTFEEQSFALHEVLVFSTVLSVGLLLFAWRRYAALKREVARRVAAEQTARQLAYQDPLTGLANRRQFEEALRQAAGSPPAAGHVHAVLLLDLNGFKQINDTYGHGAGDEVLIVVAQRLLRDVRENDLVARLGGDEFIVLARHLLGPDDAASIALRIIQGLSEPVAAGTVRHQVGAGIGVALLPDDASTADEAIRKADLALYRAKAERRSTFRFFEEDMDRLMRERDRIERDLRQALEESRIQPRFRPSIDLKSGRIVGFEAVPSWRTATEEEIPPERFLPIAEETGLGHRIAADILKASCEAAACWPQEVALSIDILPSQLKDQDLSASILRTLDDAGFAPERLEVDVSENLVVQDLNAAKRTLAPLRAAGVRIALDNFGTGYSNLYHMQEFGIDKVKIDRRFVENMVEDDAARMVRALAGLGHGLGLSVSADGIPEDAAGHLLLASGIREGQPQSGLVSAAEASGMVAGSRDRFAYGETR
nr:EAL domain-containing protein [Shinella pollutisoli]